MAAAKPMTKSQIADALAEKTGVTKKVATQFMEEYANLAYKEAARRMAWPITASTATTLAAFMPLLFWPAAESYCPAQAMLGKIFPIDLRYQIFEEESGEKRLVNEGVYSREKLSA